MTAAGNRACIWRGPSLFDGAPLIVLARGFRRFHKGRAKTAVANRKTGDVVSTVILRADLSPYAMLRTRRDGSTCGDCAMRPRGPRGGAGERACYPHLGMLQNQWEAWRRGLYPDEPIATLGQILRGQRMRFGSFGDPAMLPREVWELFAALSDGYTGYTHQWRWADRGLRKTMMASVDDPADKRAACALGYRTFRTLLPGEPLDADEISCPASAEAGHKSTCDACGLCDGSRGEGDERKNIAIVRHGYPPAVAAYDAMRARRLRVLS